MIRGQLTVRLGAVTFALALIGASAAAQTPAAPDSFWPGDSWRTSTAERQGIDSVELAKIDYLLMCGGVWHGTRVVSEDWIRLSTRQHVLERPSTGYGYLWWLPLSNPGLFEGRGRGGQRLSLWPQRLAVRDGFSHQVSLKLIPVGLDGIYRFSNNSRFDWPLAAKGSWTSEREFDMVLNEPANDRAYDFRFRFDENAAGVTVSERTGFVDSTTIRASRVSEGGKR
jgi:CubicO group peptidase (beta-lactamase class C family)